jgi:SRSO17 transposase
VASVQSRLDAHFLPYLPCFQSATRSVAEAAKGYLRGLFQCRRANMEGMSEQVADSHYPRLHHMLSESPWDVAEVRRQLMADANAYFGHGGTALVIDESGFAKKGTHSAGVARQWNGRLGKTDNSQVGVFAAVTRDQVAALVDGELYLPKEWVEDADRCDAAGIPKEVQTLRSKGEIALAMVRRQRQAGLHFDYAVFDGGYGHLPWFVRALADDGETFLAEVHSDQMIYLDNPHPAVPPRRSNKGRAPSRPKSTQAAQTVAAWAAGQPAQTWRRLAIRDGEKGEIVADFLQTRVFVWNGTESTARHWHLLVRREPDGVTLKYCLSNAKEGASPRQLVTMQTARYFVERAFNDAKSACGMADYQVRGWHAWHHHMALVMVALMFLAKERFACRDTHRLLSCLDIVEMLRHKLPKKVQSDDDLVTTIAERHRRRANAMKSAYNKQGLNSPPWFSGEI